MNRKTHLSEPLELQEDDLKKEIGLWGLTANIINIVIGAGIFVLPAIIAQKMGSSSIIAYLFCGALAILIMLCFAEIGSKIIKTGGSYTYIETVFGPYAGFLGGNLLLVGSILSDAAVSNALVEVCASIWPIFNEPWLRISFLAIIFFGLAYINILGVKTGIGLVKFTTIAKLLPLLLLVSFGWKDVILNNLVWDSLPSIKQLGETALILFFAFQGGEVGLNVAGEVIKPRITIPRAIFMSMAIIMLFYMLVQLVAQGVLGDSLAQQTGDPLAKTALIVFGSFGFILLSFGAAISMFGTLSGVSLNNPRLLYAFARDKVIPTKSLAKIHKKYATPHNAIMLYTFSGFVAATLGGFEQLAQSASLSILLLYLGVILAVIRLRFIYTPKKEEFTIKGGLLVPILAVIVIGYFLAHASSTQVGVTFLMFVIFSFIYLISKRINK
ncbi:APC family permease [Aegicerativicinus sediminis]|uniref:APC family permease n=1 Tax=Aegicerativicinus sediminis TaxID=2893202 RepID=UPI001E356A37|nr:APC family permease [Aegicerativicinus sediminis]